jgi:MoxR-like ATPase
MQENQVTIDGDTYVLEKPFFVIATQNPVENAGTYPLPEAQMDRFLMRLSVGLLQPEEEVQMMQRFLKGEVQQQLHSVCTRVEFLDMQETGRGIYIHPDLLRYMQKIVQATRNHEQIRLGVSPRGSLAFVRVVQAWALIQGRDYVIPEDIRQLAVPVLAHRMLVTRNSALLQGNPAAGILTEILNQIPVPMEDWERL